MGLIKWILYFILAIVITFFVDYFLKNIKKLYIKIIIIISKLILSLVFAFLPLGGPLFLRPIQGILVALHITTFASAINDVILIFIKKERFVLNRIAYLFLSIIIFIYGTININTINVNEYTLYSSKVNNDYSFVFVSDVHVGNSQLSKTRVKLVETIKNLDVDFVMLGGDITDDYTTKDEMIEFYSLFKDFEIPVYFIYGNHDTQNDQKYHVKDSYEIEELTKAQNDNGIIVLKDESVCIGDIQIIGRLDKSRSVDRLENNNLNIDNSKYTICFDHQPCNLKGTDLPDVDLQVSGHTHAGQFLPLNILYNTFIMPSYGKYCYQDTTLIVSSGACGWRVPFRTDHKSEIELITIKHKWGCSKTYK